jgi:hypothetical protein
MLQIFLKKLFQIFIFTLLLSSSTYAQTALQRLDGEWYSPQWRYGYSLKNGLGVATSTNSPNFQIGQTIIQLSATSATTFTGQQVYTDGNFYRVNVILQPDGRLYFEGEKNAKWLMERVATAPQSIGNKNNDYQNLLLGKWYHKSDTTSDNFSMMAQYVQDFLPNGTISEQAQYVTTMGDGTKLSCLANTNWEWSTSGNKIYQKIIASHVIPDFIKDRNGTPIDNPELLRQVCEVVKKDKSQRQLTTSVFTIIKIDNKVNVYQYQDSRGILQESTDYRVNQGLSYFKVK